MKEETYAKLQNIIRVFIERRRRKLRELRVAYSNQDYPFHRLIFSDQAILAARLERSTVTQMGNWLYPNLARGIAEEFFSDVHLNYNIEGQLNDASLNMISQIVTELRASSKKNPRDPDYPTEMQAIMGSPGGGWQPVTLKADLYIGDFTDGPLFVEMKTPTPNLDMAAESKRKMLTFEAMFKRNGVEGSKSYLGLTYNPFGTREDYSHDYTKKIMDMDNEVLIGEEFWDHIGGPGTYQILLQLIDEEQSPLL